MSPSASREPRWRRRSAARPEEILAAALTVFSDKGFDAARVEDVAAQAGISKAGVYLYFPSKTALLQALIEAHVAPLAAQVENLAQAGAENPKLALRLVARAAVERLKDPKTIAVPRLVISVAGRFPAIAQYYRTTIVARAKGALERLVRAGVDNGQFRRVDPSAVVRAFIGPLFFEAMWAHVLMGETALTTPETLVEQHLDILLNGLESRA